MFALPIIQNFEKVKAAFQATKADSHKVFNDLRYLQQSNANRLYETDYHGRDNSKMLSLDHIDYGAKFLY